MDRRQFIGSSGLALFAGMLPRLAEAAAIGGNADKALLTLVDGIFERDIDESPETATSLGLDKGKRAAARSQLDSYTKESQARALAADRASLAALKAIDRAQLSASGKLNHDVVAYMLEKRVDGASRYPYGSTVGYYVPMRSAS